MTEMLYYSATFLFLMVYFLNASNWNHKGLRYSRFPNLLGSRINHYRHVAGMKWTTRGELKRHYSESKKNTVLVDEFRFFPEVTDEIRLMFGSESMPIFMNPKDMTKQLLFIGPPGSGKTEMILSLLKQRFYSRAIIRDVKNEDYKPRYGNLLTGLICDMYDDRAAIWDIFSEKNFDRLIDLICVNLATGADPNQRKGGNNSFFYNSAAERLKTIFEVTRIHSRQSLLSPWVCFEQELDGYIKSATEKDSRENKDVYNNLVLVLEVLRLWSWRARDGSQLFTISGFFENNYNLILSGTNCAAYYTALIAAIVFEQINRETKKDDYTLYLLDEYLTMNFDEKAREYLHTAIRGKGGIVFVGMQFIPTENPTVKQLLKSIWHVAFVFKTTDEETKKMVKDFFGKVTYIKYEISKNKHVFDIDITRKYNQQERQVEDEFFKDSFFTEIPDFHHLTIFKSGEAYLGYTPLDSTPAKYPTQIDYKDLEQFKKYIYIDKKMAKK